MTDHENQQPASRARYEALDLSIRTAIPFNEWLWMSDATKDNVTQAFIEPDFDE